MKELFRFISFAFLTAILFSCSYQKPGSNDYFVKVEGKTIKKRTDAFTRAYILGDTTFLNNIFTADARILGPNEKEVAGKEAIGQLNSKRLKDDIHQYEKISKALYGGGNIIVDEGNYLMISGPDSILDRGNYISVWKKVNGNWKIYSTIWNSSLPLQEATVVQSD